MVMRLLGWYNTKVSRDRGPDEKQIYWNEMSEERYKWSIFYFSDYIPIILKIKIPREINPESLYEFKNKLNENRIRIRINK